MKEKFNSSANYGESSGKDKSGKNNNNRAENNKVGDKEESIQSKIFQENRRLLSEWTTYPRIRKKPTRHWQQLFRNFYPNDEEWWNFHNKIGGAETISLMMRNISVDKNGDGVLSEAEMLELESVTEKTTDHVLSQLASTGVVGALIISVVFGCVISPLDPTSESVDFFGSTFITVMKYAYFILICYGLFESFALVYISVRQYLQLCLWMPTPELKSAWLADISLVPTALSCNAAITSIALSVPFAVTIQVSPGAGLICLFLTLMFIKKMLDLSYFDVTLIAHLHAKACMLLNGGVNAEPQDE